MPATRGPRWLALPFLALVATLSIGCGGDDQAHLEALAQYTPENLADELIIRYQATQRPSKIESKSAKAAAKAGGSSGREEKLSGEQPNPHDDPSAANAKTADDVVQEIADKAKTIESPPPPQVYETLIKHLDTDTRLPTSDKETLKTKLKKAMGV